MNITWKIGGEAGFGIMTTGVMFSRLCTRHGYHIFDYSEYPSLIRGGHNVYEVHIGETEVFSQEKNADLLFALNQETYNLHKKELKNNGLMVYDPDNIKINSSDFTGKNIILYSLPFTKITKDAGLLKVMENNVVLGASAALLFMDLDVLNDLIADSFRDKGNEIISANQKAAKLGFDYVTDNQPQNWTGKLPKIAGEQKMVISGNEAGVLGAISAGCKFYAAYPMTPTSNALHVMAQWGPKYGIVVKHAEDEISVINMTIGASYAGVRSMLGTAGGGFSLMVEGLGLAGITETPLVILMGMRPGPATGMPTWTGQGDLRFVIHASQDEAPRIILAPGDMEEMYYMTAEAFNLADIYQMPVFILIDKYLAEGHKSTVFFDSKKVVINRGKLLNQEEIDKTENYLRYKLTDDGISPRALPGMEKTLFTANSYEHNEYGYSTEDTVQRINQVSKRNRKMTVYQKTIPDQKVYGDENSELTIVAWGSTKGPVLQALNMLKQQNYSRRIDFLHLTHLWPMPVEFVTKFLGKSSKMLLIEGNSQAQLGGLIRQETGIEIKNKYLRFDGRPFYPEDIIERIKLLIPND